MGPTPEAEAEKTAVPTAGVGGAAVIATRVPQRAQNTSTSGTTGVPQPPQTARDTEADGGAFAMRPPHLGQNGSDGSTAVPQYGQGALPGGTELRSRTGRAAAPAGGTGGNPGEGRTPAGATGAAAPGGTDGADDALDEPGVTGFTVNGFETRVGGTPNRFAGSGCCTPPIVSPNAALTAPLFAIGLPQSMQNFEVGSFSRPQTAQRSVTGPEDERGECREYRAATTAAGEGNGCRMRRRSRRDRLARVMRIPRVRPGLLALVLLLLARPLSGQVRPDLAWQTFETDHFRIHFTAETETLARRTVVLAERAYAELSTRLTPPRGTIDLVLADNVDFANGYATPYPTNRIVLYARPPIAESALRNHADWTRMVLTHELAHIFHLDRARGVWGGLQKVFGRAAPLFPNLYAPAWVTEGLAVNLETELAGGGRLAGTEFPALARAAAADDALPALDALSLGTLHYPLGNAAYAYGAYAMARGDGSRLKDFVEAQSAQLIPFRLDATARRGFGLTFSEYWTRWRDSVRVAVSMAANSAANAGANAAAAPISLTAHGLTARYPRYAADGSILYVADDGAQTVGVYRLTRNGPTVHRARVARRQSIDAVVPTPDGSLVLAELDYVDPYSIRSALLLERGTPFGRRRRAIAPAERLSHPDLHAASGRLVAVRTDAGSTELVTLARATADSDANGDANGDADTWEPPRRLAEGSLDRTWADPRFSRAGDRVAAVEWRRGGRMSVVVLDLAGREQGRFAPLATGRGRMTILSSPAWVPGDSAIVFVSDHEGRPMLYLGDISSGRIARVWTTATALATPDVSADGRELVAVELLADGYHVAVQAMPTTLDLRAAPSDSAAAAAMTIAPAAADLRIRERAYSPWSQLAPSWFLPVLRQTGRGLTEFGALLGSSDIVGQHRWSLEAAGSGRPGDDRNGFEVNAFGTYTWSGLGNPVLQLTVQNEWQHGAVFNQTTGARVATLAQRASSAGVQAVLSRPRVRLSTWTALGAEYERTDYRTYPGVALRGLTNPAFSMKIHTGAVTASAGFSTLQRPTRAFSAEDGVSAVLTFRQRFGSGVQFEDINEVIATATAAKSMPWGGHARHVLALRAAAATAGHATTTALSAGGVNGGALQLLPGVVIGGGSRTFGVRGFDGSTQLGVRAAAASAEYRAPLALVDRGYRFLPLFLQRASLVAFADAGAAWCTRSVADSFICPPTLPAQNWLGSAGGELTLDGSLSYDQIYRFRFGVAQVMHGKVYARQLQTFYFALGTNF